MSHDLTDLEKEKAILRAVRKTLAQVVVDVTPDSRALKSPLQDQTIKDIRMCFGLVSAREREIMDAMKLKNNVLPHFIDEPKKVSNVVNFNPSGRTASKQQASEEED